MRWNLNWWRSLKLVKEIWRGRYLKLIILIRIGRPVSPRRCGYMAMTSTEAKVWTAMTSIVNNDLGSRTFGIGKNDALSSNGRRILCTDHRNASFMRVMQMRKITSRSKFAAIISSWRIERSNERPVLAHTFVSMDNDVLCFFSSILETICQTLAQVSTFEGYALSW